MSQALVKTAFSSITGNSIVKKKFSPTHTGPETENIVQNTLADLKATGLSRQCLGRGILTPCQSELLHKRSNNSICYYRKPHQHLLNRQIFAEVNIPVTVPQKHISPHTTCCKVFEQTFQGCTLHL